MSDTTSEQQPIVDINATTETTNATTTTTSSTATTTTTETATTSATTTSSTGTTAKTSSPPTNNNKRKEAETPKYIETRIRKKAREALDLISNTKQRQASVFNLLGSDYTGPSEMQLEMIFRLFSRNGKTIGAEELKGVIRSMGKRPLTKRIDKILLECSGNGETIEMDEFVRYMQKKAIEKAKLLGLLDSDEEEDEEPEQGGDTDEEDNTTPKKKAATAKPKSSKKKQAAKKTTTATTTTTSGATTIAANKAITKQPSFFQPLKRGASIVQYYTENAGVHTVNNIELDKFNNPLAIEYDLGIEGAFSDFTLLIGKFYSTNLECINELKSKGFTIVEALTQKQFITLLPTSNVAFIISSASPDNSCTEKEFTDAVEQYHKVGKGLFIWNDNSPWTCQGNWVTSRLFNGLNAQGNEPGTKTLTLGKDGNEQNHFGSHLITSGIVNLYEGITISSYPKQLPTDKLDVLATSSGGNSVMLVTNNEKMDENCGRVVIDCGFTKLFSEYLSAGTSRYIKNASVWLLALDHRFKLGVDTTSEIAKPVEEPVWQFQHNNWIDYDRDASKIVEETYQEWLTNQHIDVRSVKSGSWAYQIDFKNNTQTNIQHSDHKTRPIRRILKNIIVPTQA